MTNAQLTRSIKAELAGAGIPFDLIEVNDTEIKITQVGLHEALPAICQILDRAGLWSFDEDTGTEDATSRQDDLHSGQVTVNVLKRRVA